MKAYDDAIVGLGPVGCAAAILLAEEGLRVVAFERDTKVCRLPWTASILNITRVLQHIVNFMNG